MKDGLLIIGVSSSDEGASLGVSLVLLDFVYKLITLMTYYSGYKAYSFSFILR